MNATAAGLVEFLNASPSPFHCVETVAGRLRDAGFSEVTDHEPFDVRPGRGAFLRRAGSVYAWLVGAASPAEGGFRLIGAHTDSPNLRLKPNPSSTREGYAMWGVEPYGGALLHTWTDRDLGLAGRVAVRRDGRITTELVKIERPIARTANLAIHLDREVNTRGLVLNKQTHLPPIVGLASSPTAEALLADLVGAPVKDLLGFDVGLYDVQPATLGGLDGEFIFGARLDNQASCYVALEALLSAASSGAVPLPNHTAFIALFDHEECGSSSERGAESVLLARLLEDLVDGHPEKSVGGLGRAMAKSFLISADMAHGVHPNFADRHDPQHKPMLGGGPVIKTNVNMNYATDAETAARFRAACLDEGVPYQEFVVRSDTPCGSTIGSIAASGLAVRTVDVGCAMLSMHSIREQAGSADVTAMARVMRRILVEG
jgi:aspartyl aminopeptidase